MTFKTLITAIVLLFFFSNIFAQEIFIVAYKGNISLSPDRSLNHNFRYAISRGMSVTFDIGASALLYANDKYFTVDKISIKTTYTYAQIVDRFNKTLSQKNNGFSAYLQKTHLYTNEVKEASTGAVPGAIKGIDDGTGKYVKDPLENIFPQDSVRLLTNSIHLKWETAGKTYGTKLMVLNAQSNDTVRNVAASNKGELDIAIEKEGIYNWFLFSKLENKKSIDRIIIKPSPAETTRLKDELENFKKQIATFDEELKALILEDYLYQNRIIE